ncbi:cobalamin biosynthesis protein CbiX [Chlorobaculum limnaeum]|uniref:Cobalamin biosynthesis protein CbiX n=2 Tax=Chlorobaculum limnaeum TaxID=274537 RepID=A0A1D8D1N6_CHLLM|nr:cobalamin biosynthesis protein CbiX [Chlorobaculum limnaeum]
MRLPTHPVRYLLSLLLVALTACTESERRAEPSGDSPANRQKIAVLLINHGSRSSGWKRNLLELERRVAPRIRAIDGIDTLSTAFMEHAEPSISTALKALDRNGYSDIVVIPLFLSTGAHVFDDIPTIIGKKENPATLEQMRLEGIERYIPAARTHLAAPLDFSGLLASNVLRRAGTLSDDPSREGLVLVGYGSEPFQETWERTFEQTGRKACAEGGFAGFTTAWCGHVAHYSPDSTSAAIGRILKQHDRAIVIPLLVSFSERFQIDIIGRGVASVVETGKHVRYRPDAILPDPDLEAWIISTAGTLADGIRKKQLRK